MNKLLSILSVVTTLGSTVLVSSLTKNSVVNNYLLKEQWFPFINIAQGIEANQDITDMQITANNDVYAWNANNLYKSTDGNNFTNILARNITSVAIKGNNIYVGTEDDLLKSDDGYIFTEVSNVFANKHILKIVVSQAGIIYVATNYGLYESIDDNNFICISDEVVTNLVVNEAGVIYITHDSCLDKSKDGKHWTNVYTDDNYLLTDITTGPDNEVCVVVDAPNNSYLALISSSDDIEEIKPYIGIINKIQINSAGIIIVASERGIYQNLTNLTFTAYLPFIDQEINTFTLDLNKRIYVSVAHEGVYEVNLLKNLINNQPPDYVSSLYDNTLVYKKPQYIDLKGIYLAQAMLDGEGLDIPTTNLELTVGKHELTLIVDDDHKQFVSIFGGDVNTGAITYNFEIKDNIDNRIVSYHVNRASTLLETGLISDSGNTKGSEIIETWPRASRGQHQSALSIDVNDRKRDLIDFRNSYYISGTVDETKNNFNSSGSKNQVSEHFRINEDGIYQLHLVDAVGNVFNSYLELGAENNNKLKGHIFDSDVTKLAKELNVKISVDNPSEKNIIMDWLQKYKLAADEAFNKSLKNSGKGFDFSVEDLPNGYASFLDKITYENSKTLPAINLDNLRKEIYNFSNDQLNNKLSKLAVKELNIDTQNVVDKKSLNDFSIWVNNYKKYLEENKNIIVNKITRLATRGFANEEQIQKTKKNVLITSDFNEKFLNNVIWDDNLQKDKISFRKLVNVKELKNFIIDKVDKTYPELKNLYENYLSNAIKKVDMHGYLLNEIMGKNRMPQTKHEIDNYMYNERFSEWLQQEANSKFSKWQWTMGLSIGIPLFIIVGAPPLYFFWSYTQRYNPRDYRIYKRLEKIDQQRYMKKKPKKWWRL